MKEAYRIRRWALPDLSTIEQCKNDESIEKTNLALKEGCQIYGYMEVNRVCNIFPLFVCTKQYQRLVFIDEHCLSFNLPENIKTFIP